VTPHLGWNAVWRSLNSVLSEVVAQPDPIREFKYESACFSLQHWMSRNHLLQKNSDGSYGKDQTGHVAYFLNFNGIDPNSVKFLMRRSILE
jgi:hypothetical protein